MDVPLAANLVVTREITMLGAFRFAEEMAEAVRLLAAGLPVGTVVTHEFAAADAARAIAVAADPAASTKILLRFEAARPAPHELPVVIVGLMGAGKTSLAARLADLTGRPLRDSDPDITAATGATPGPSQRSVARTSCTGWRSSTSSRP